MFPMLDTKPRPVEPFPVQTDTLIVALTSVIWAFSQSMMAADAGYRAKDLAEEYQDRYRNEHAQCRREERRHEREMEILEESQQRHERMIGRDIWRSREVRDRGSRDGRS